MKINKIIKSTVEEELEITGAKLLSTEEAEKYLTEEERKYDKWWLRSPGSYFRIVDSCNDGGDISNLGCFVDSSNVCVRPALQITNLESSNLKIGDTFEFSGFNFKVISENLAWMYRQDIGCYAFNFGFKNGNDYETSDIKKFVDKWFKSL